MPMAIHYLLDKLPLVQKHWPITKPAQDSFLLLIICKAKDTWSNVYAIPIDRKDQNDFRLRCALFLELQFFMKIKVWGCRGSLPSPGPWKIIVYGGKYIHVSQWPKRHLDYLGWRFRQFSGLGKVVTAEVKELSCLTDFIFILIIHGFRFFFQPMYNPKNSSTSRRSSTTIEPLLTA